MAFESGDVSGWRGAGQRFPRTTTTLGDISKRENDEVAKPIRNNGFAGTRHSWAIQAPDDSVAPIVVAKRTFFQREVGGPTGRLATNNGAQYGSQ